MLKKIISLLAIAAMVLVVLFLLNPNGMFDSIKNIFTKSYESLDATTFKQRYEESKSAVLLDVRTPQEVAEGTIPGSVNIDFDSRGFHSKIDSLDKGKEYFVFCQGGSRSSKTCYYMGNHGFKAYSLKGGFDKWTR